MDIEEGEEEGLAREQLSTLDIVGGSTDPSSGQKDHVVLISCVEAESPNAMATSEMLGEDYVYLTQTCNFGKELPKWF